MNPLHHFSRSTLSMALAGTFGLAGCAAPQLNHWDAQFGDSARSMRAAQVIDPQAPTRNGTRTTTLDGKAVIESSDRYVESFKAPPPQNIFIIGAPTTGGGGGGR